MRKQIRDKEGNVLIVQTTDDGKLAIHTPRLSAKFRPDQLEEIRQAIADGRAVLLQGKRWPS